MGGSVRKRWEVRMEVGRRRGEDGIWCIWIGANGSAIARLLYKWCVSNHVGVRKVCM